MTGKSNRKSKRNQSTTRSIHSYHQPPYNDEQQQEYQSVEYQQQHQDVQYQQEQHSHHQQYQQEHKYEDNQTKKQEDNDQQDKEQQDNDQQDKEQQYNDQQDKEQQYNDQQDKEQQECMQGKEQEQGQDDEQQEIVIEIEQNKCDEKDDQQSKDHSQRHSNNKETEQKQEQQQEEQEEKQGRQKVVQMKDMVENREEGWMMSIICKQKYQMVSEQIENGIIWILDRSEQQLNKWLKERHRINKSDNTCKSSRVQKIKEGVVMVITKRHKKVKQRWMKIYSQKKRQLIRLVMVGRLNMMAICCLLEEGVVGIYGGMVQNYKWVMYDFKIDYKLWKQVSQQMELQCRDLVVSFGEMDCNRLKNRSIEMYEMIKQRIQQKKNELLQQ